MCKPECLEADGRFGPCIADYSHCMDSTVDPHATSEAIKLANPMGMVSLEKGTAGENIASALLHAPLPSITEEKSTGRTSLETNRTDASRKFEIVGTESVLGKCGSGRAPIHLQVTPSRTVPSLGLALSAQGHPTYLTIDAIAEDGLVQEWNKLQPQMQVLPGYIITSVNGNFCDGLKMLDSIHNAKVGATICLRVESMANLSGL